MRELFEPKTSDLNLPRVLHALSDPIRLMVVNVLSERDDVNCNELYFDQPKSTMSHHFRVLREAGIIRISVNGTERLNSLRTVDLERRFPSVLESIIASYRDSVHLPR